MKKYDLSNIMSAAWRIFRKGVQSFAVALRMAWANAKAHNAAKAAKIAALTRRTPYTVDDSAANSPSEGKDIPMEFPQKHCCRIGVETPQTNHPRHNSNINLS